MRRVLKWVVIGFAVWWVIKDPSGASAAVHKIAGVASQAASSFATVISSI